MKPCHNNYYCYNIQEFEFSQFTFRQLTVSCTLKLSFIFLCIKNRRESSLRLDLNVEHLLCYIFIWILGSGSTCSIARCMKRVTCDVFWIGSKQILIIQMFCTLKLICLQRKKMQLLYKRMYIPSNLQLNRWVEKGNTSNDTNFSGATKTVSLSKYEDQFYMAEYLNP